MPDPSHSLEELVVSNMWGIAALVQVLERKGVLSQKEIVAAIQALRGRDGDAPGDLDTQGEGTESEPEGGAESVVRRRPDLKPV